MRVTQITDAVTRLNFALTPEQRLDARRALKVLEGSGLTLEGAALRALSGRRAAAQKLTRDVVEAFNLSRATKLTRRGVPLRAATLTYYEEKLQPLLDSTFAERPFDGITRTEFAAWLHSLKTGASMRAGVARACRALWRWAILQDPPLASTDATVGSSFAAPLGTDLDRLVLDVGRAKKILDAATWDRDAVAIMLFAGVRPEEVRGENKPPLLWAHVNKQERYIRIPPEIAKVPSAARLMEGLPQTVWRWLTPKDAREPISPYSDRSIRERAQEAAGLVGKWPHDCFRHTAATYLLAATQDAGKVADWLGWEGRPAMLHQTYRGRLTIDHQPVDRAMAKAYMDLRPNSD